MSEGWHGTLVLGWTPDGRGTYDLSDGSLETRQVDIQGRGSKFVQSGGEHTIYGYGKWGLAVGSSPATARFDYVLKGGLLKVLTQETIDYYGLFDQDGGTNQIGKRLAIFAGSYGLADGTLRGIDSKDAQLSIYISTPSGFIGFTQTGGDGSFDLSGGSLDAKQEYIGGEGTGEFGQKGDGAVTMEQGLYLGYESTGTGSYRISGGRLSADDEFIGYEGTGIFIHTDGRNTLGGKLYLGDAFHSTGSYELNGGRLNAEDEYIGLSGAGTFMQYGGKNWVRNNLYIN